MLQKARLSFPIHHLGIVFSREMCTLFYPENNSKYFAGRHIPSKFKVEVIAHCLVNIPSSVISTAEEPFKNGITRDTLVPILARTLLRIVPNVILNKREEVIPLIDLKCDSTSLRLRRKRKIIATFI